ncbi:putative DNA-polymerase epsilon catalytic subunit [Sesbania bispinosa]|nr:putative DNA-polymerase epsilon catalytic subunit [Sesbania bispinosa]
MVSVDGCHTAMGGFIDLEELNHDFSSSTEGDATKDSHEQSDARVVKDAIVNAVPDSSFTPASQHGDEEGSGVTEGNI